MYCSAYTWILARGAVRAGGSIPGRRSVAARPEAATWGLQRFCSFAIWAATFAASFTISKTR